MSMWSDQAESDVWDPGFETPDSIGDFVDRDLEAPVPGEDDPGLEGPVFGDGGWSPEDGYPDSTGSVRIWVDDDRRVTKVRVSNRWRERSRGTTLSSMFDEAFLLAFSRVGFGTEPDQSTPAVDAPKLSGQALAELQQQSFELAEESARLDALPESEVRPSRWEGAAVVGTSENQLVTVRLTLFGYTERVVFDDAWLAQSRVSQICDAVMEAHQDAYSRFVPPVYEPGEREELAFRMDRVSATLMAMMKQGW